MMGERTGVQGALFYGFNLERHVSADHILPAIDRFVDLGLIRQQLGPSTARRDAHRLILS